MEPGAHCSPLSLEMLFVATSNQEVTFDNDELIVSKTDLKGKITYANRVFMRVSNFSEPALLGQPHNIIRHEDMPRGVFYGLWKSVNAGREFFGFVKNRTADDNYYWVFANITPDYHDNKLIGFYSVRRCAPAAAKEAAMGLYRQMLAIEKSKGKAEGPRASWDWLMEQCRAAGYPSYEEFIISLYQKYL
ncbi:PAS domain-containing protein [Marinobacterium lutimaris]|uniref:PAS fold-containing protein n=1 Tax=Marinobacterium lutimaris TaxID=568106 RepID=A0A1H5Z3J9_9GAMM|nr:PAS domain-containing protein [Marinobacterium lutimaris]SEG30842.1 PAS fold-containing protein [Marinobacterium lutimaris]